MRRRGLLVLSLMLLVLAGGAIVGVSRIRLSALDAPGRLETYAATKAKHWIVGRSARSNLPAAPLSDTTSVAVGQMLYRGECAACHGLDGRTPTDIGRWMYPRTLDLGSAEVQEWSDPELFWIIRHGIRLSGMPGFGKIHSHEQIWHLVHYVRSLRAQPKQ